MARKKTDPMDTQPTCASCKFWREETDRQDDIRWGVCRRNPPTGVSVINPETGEEQPEAVWPPTGPDDWCGQWSPQQ